MHIIRGRQQGSACKFHKVKILRNICDSKHYSIFKNYLSPGVIPTNIHSHAFKSLSPEVMFSIKRLNFKVKYFLF